MTISIQRGTNTTQYLHLMLLFLFPAIEGNSFQALYLYTPTYLVYYIWTGWALPYYLSWWTDGQTQLIFGNNTTMDVYLYVNTYHINEVLF